LLQSLVDVISSQGWLKPALAAMEISQMVVQGMWDKDSLLLQMPHVNQEIVQRFQSHSPPVESIFDVLELDDDVRDRLFQLPQEKISDVAIFCNAYPNVELSYELDIENNQTTSGDTVSVVVNLTREVDEDDEDAIANVGRVVCPRYGMEKIESWWLVIGDKNANAMMSIKRITIGKSAKVSLVYDSLYMTNNNNFDIV
jgi:pre-mRNA-splicing helicase BRR2